MSIIDELGKLLEGIELEIKKGDKEFKIDKDKTIRIKIGGSNSDNPIQTQIIDIRDSPENN